MRKFRFSHWLSWRYEPGILRCVKFWRKYLYLLLLEGKGKDKVVPVHATKADRDTRSITPHILNPCTRMSSQFQALFAFTPCWKPGTQWIGGLGGYQNRSGCFWKEKNSLPLPGFDCPPRSLSCSYSFTILVNLNRPENIPKISANESRTRYRNSQPRFAVQKHDSLHTS